MTYYYISHQPLISLSQIHSKYKTTFYPQVQQIIHDKFKINFKQPNTIKQSLLFNTQPDKQPKIKIKIDDLFADLEIVNKL